MAPEVRTSGEAGDAGRQVWDIPEVRRVAGVVRSNAESVAAAGDLLASLDVPGHDGAGGTVAQAFADFRDDFRDAALDAVHRRGERLDRLSESVLRGTLATESTDAANGLAVSSAVEGVPGLVGDGLGGGSSTSSGSPVGNAR